MFEVVLHQPEIPPNTGNAIRLCANTGSRLHLVGPLGFELDDARLRRAGLDYHEWAELRVHASWAACSEALGERVPWAFSTRGRRRHVDARFQPGDVLLFGAESRGLPPALLAELPDERVLRLPMRSTSRSVNLSNAVAIGVYEAWRQNGFRGGA